MIIYLDLDGVLADFVGGACDWHGIENPYKWKENLGSFDIVKAAGFKKPFWNFSEDFWADLDKTPECDEILATLLRLGDVRICTSPGHMPAAAAGKMRWCQEHVPGIKLCMYSEKHELAKASRVLVDDRDSNILKFEHAGGHAIRIPRPWNGGFMDEPLQAFHTQVELFT